MKLKKRLFSFALALMLSLTLMPIAAPTAHALEASHDCIAATEKIGNTSVTFDYVRENGRRRIVANDGVTEIWYAVNIGDARNLGNQHCTISFDRPVSVSINGGAPKTVSQLVGGKDYGWRDVIEAFDLLSGARVYFEGVYGVLDGVEQMGEIDQHGQENATTAPLEKVGVSSPTLVTYNGANIDWKTLYNTMEFADHLEVKEFALIDLNGDTIPELIAVLAPPTPENRPGGMMGDMYDTQPTIPTVFSIMKADQTVRSRSLFESSYNGYEIHINAAGQLYFYLEVGQNGYIINQSGAFEQINEPWQTLNSTVTDQLTWLPYSESAFASALDNWKSSATPTPQSANITLDRTEYGHDSSERMTITVTGITQQMVDDHAIVMINNPKDPASTISTTYKGYGLLTQTGTMTFQLWPGVCYFPGDEDYEVLFYLRSYVNESSAGISYQLRSNALYKTVKFRMPDNYSGTTTPPVTPPTPAGQTVNPTASTVYVNGAAKGFDAYLIGGNNYFKLRDLAMVLNGTAKQFEVGYDNATAAVSLTSGKPYTVVGGELVPGDGTAKTATPTKSKIYLDGVELNLTVYLIGGNNFFKLRDLMSAIDVYVGYDNATRNITMDTSRGYVAEGTDTASSPVNPTTPATTAQTVTLSKQSYAPGETISVTVTGVTQYMIDNYAFVALYSAGAQYADYKAYEYLKSATATVTFTAPSEPGAYEMRLYNEDSNKSPEMRFVTTVSLTVA